MNLNSTSCWGFSLSYIALKKYNVEKCRCKSILAIPPLLSLRSLYACKLLFGSPLFMVSNICFWGNKKGLLFCVCRVCWKGWVGYTVLENWSIVLNRHFNTGSGLFSVVCRYFKGDLRVTGCVVCVLLRIRIIFWSDGSSANCGTNLRC